jgi:uncharacterized membrane protein YdbT with pleckstrin-like domain
VDLNTSLPGSSALLHLAAVVLKLLCVLHRAIGVVLDAVLRAVLGYDQLGHALDSFPVERASLYGWFERRISFVEHRRAIEAHLRTAKC